MTTTHKQLGKFTAALASDTALPTTDDDITCRQLKAIENVLYEKTLGEIQKIHPSWKLRAIADNITNKREEWIKWENCSAADYKRALVLEHIFHSFWSQIFDRNPALRCYPEQTVFDVHSDLEPPMTKSEMREFINRTVQEISGKDSTYSPTSKLVVEDINKIGAVAFTNSVRQEIKNASPRTNTEIKAIANDIAAAMLECIEPAKSLPGHRK